jgi:4-hydroxy 2-oxovalerate aldolase
VACYIHQIPLAMDMVKDAVDKGYETTLNLMAVSVVQERELEEALAAVAECPADALYLVDSYGAFYSEQVRDLTIMYLNAMEGTGKEIGFHGHNNQMLAYANTIEACIVGANRLDATFDGLGRGAGNCPMELLVGFLKNPKFKLRPVLEAIQEHVVPLRDELDWGFSHAYMITGQMNRHPRDAMKWRAGETPDACLDFYDQLMEED